MDPETPLVLFIARGVPGQTADYLERSLEVTRRHYIETYGPHIEELPFLTFSRPGNAPLSLQVRSTITDFMTQGVETGRSVVLVLVFAGDPRRFYEVVVDAAMLGAWNEVDYDSDSDWPVLPGDTQEFVEMISAYFIINSIALNNHEEQL
ncbi:hypothetical protein FE257_012945 [Aspergillus nanangensis]|uniref:Uncharacterized protein n=1 Tax=Aspergillus nanangensis TaxID=2582783 RepID=A0AAD4CGK9_ASPNN|nr:hypothetical protein FE257_012945 [Aspergillus nanangensis]